ncbi:hypothetical protein HMPREF1862_00640 [Varibaculum cambriense]|uniref:Uncharacterized protein n=1 Tax=Varibaculum cambriense TaxID=184870 RepID=A0AB34WZM6_9ACTO|nr:hypothetical protein HMPREF1862_00640 [Varibaculum cambriense]
MPFLSSSSSFKFFLFVYGCVATAIDYRHTRVEKGKDTRDIVGFPNVNH